jgi:hypothetical protein
MCFTEGAKEKREKVFSRDQRRYKRGNNVQWSSDIMAVKWAIASCHAHKIKLIENGIGQTL